MLEYTQISKYSHTNTQKWMHIRGTVMVVKIFLQIPSPWHGERPCLNIPHAPPLWSLLSFDNFKRSLTPSFKLKDWPLAFGDALPKTQTSGYFSLLTTSHSPPLSNWGINKYCPQITLYCGTERWLCRGKVVLVNEVGEVQQVVRIKHLFKGGDSSTCLIRTLYK